jgi:hypothetical protein
MPVDRVRLRYKLHQAHLITRVSEQINWNTDSLFSSESEEIWDASEIDPPKLDAKVADFYKQEKTHKVEPVGISPKDINIWNQWDEEQESTGRRDCKVKKVKVSDNKKGCGCTIF